MNKQILTLAIITAIHYSALGNYLVDQDGKRVAIQGHPWMTCYQGPHILTGQFVHANGSTIILQTKDNSQIIVKPVCDIMQKEK